MLVIYRYITAFTMVACVACVTVTPVAAKSIDAFSIVAQITLFGAFVSICLVTQLNNYDVRYGHGT